MLVFPEYSIPSAVLQACKQLSDGLNITLVAGSHLATQFSLRDYRDAGLSVTADVIGRAVCPIFVPQQAPKICQKLGRSKWESSLVPGDLCPPVPMSLWGKRAFLQVFICLDAITSPGDVKAKSAKLGPTVYAIPSLSPTVNLFYDKARLLLASGHIVLFVNGAEFGGSRVFARTEHTNRWYTGEDGRSLYRSTTKPWWYSKLTSRDNLKLADRRLSIFQYTTHLSIRSSTQMRAPQPRSISKWSRI